MYSVLTFQEEHLINSVQVWASHHCINNDSNTLRNTNNMISYDLQHSFSANRPNTLLSLHPTLPNVWVVNWQAGKLAGKQAGIGSWGNPSKSCYWPQHITDKGQRYQWDSDPCWPALNTNNTACQVTYQVNHPCKEFANIVHSCIALHTAKVWDIFHPIGHQATTYIIVQFSVV